MDKYKLILLIIFILAFAWSGINPPIPYSYWLLETSPILLAVFLFAILGRYIKLSNTSYTLIVIYMVFPLIASHYGVTGVPFGETIGHWMGITRNMYDRLTHFAFGFLGYYPIYEFVISINRKESNWNYYIPFETLLSFSAIYEIFEWLVAITVNPILAASFYGAQGDIFDTPEDMANALVGALIAMFIVFIVRKYKNKSIPETSFS
ncbi:MAG: DUF2238 domain-containing protein [Candidatus Paceibacterota bacterium]